MENTEVRRYLSEKGIHDEYIEMNRIHADENFNCRGKIIPLDVADLAKAINREGLLQPIILMPYEEEKKTETGKDFLIIAGYRRHMAHVILDMNLIRAVILPEAIPEEDARFINLNENLQREDLSFMQEAEAIKKIMGSRHVTELSVMERLGKSRGWVQTRMMALKLPKDVQEEIRAGYVNQTEVREIYTIYKKEGSEAVITAVRTLKDDKILGRKSKAIVSKIKKAYSKKIRKRPEMFEMIEHIEAMFGMGFATRALAWCSGEITNLEFNETLKIEAEKAGIEFVSMKLE